MVFCCKGFWRKVEMYLLVCLTAWLYVVFKQGCCDSNNLVLHFKMIIQVCFLFRAGFRFRLLFNVVLLYRPPFNRPPQMPEPDFPCQPPMTPFKQFLIAQDDSISEEEAVKRYNQYKLDFKKNQLNEYFLAHKHEEWSVLQCRMISC